MRNLKGSIQSNELYLISRIRPKTVGLENIIHTDINKMPEGDYHYYIHNYDGGYNSGYQVQIEFNGETFDYNCEPLRGRGKIRVATVNYSKIKGFTITSHVKGTSSVQSKEKWGIKTNQWHRVNHVMLSPNFWEGEAGIGNKHYLFFIDNVLSDETPRPFLNEFLRQDLDKHRKVFEALSSKIKVEDSKQQLSGLGFSSTQRNSLIVKATGKFSRILKVTF